MPRAEIIATGEELLSGSLVDTNSAWIADRLLQTGLQVRRISCAGDDLQDLSSALQEIAGRSDIAVLTGGLGPTEDDLTAQAAAQASGRQLVQNEQALENIQEFFARLQKEVPASNLKQALLPAGSLCLPNPVGTAPGFLLGINSCHLFALPGVPGEMRQMFKQSVIPWIEEHFAQQLQPLEIRVISCFGITESKTSQALQGFESCFPGIRLGFRFKFPVIQVRLYSRQQAKALHGQQDMQQAMSWVQQKLGDRVFSSQDQSLEQETLQLLESRNSTLAMFEACSGGLLAQLTTRTEPGRKSLLLASVINEDSQAIPARGKDPASRVRMLAGDIREEAGADFGLAVIAEKKADPGRAWVGLAGQHRSLAREFTLGYPGWQANMTALAYFALNLLRLELLGKPVE
ncbi:MAG: molybdopterin-binding protein [Desulfohalobiaceae bacterium]